MDRVAFVCRQHIGLTPHPDSLRVSTQEVEGGGEAGKDEKKKIARGWGVIGEEKVFAFLQEHFLCSKAKKRSCSRICEK